MKHLVIDLICNFQESQKIAKTLKPEPSGIRAYDCSLGDTGKHYHS